MQILIYNILLSTSKHLKFRVEREIGSISPEILRQIGKIEEKHQQMSLKEREIQLEINFTSFPFE